MPCTVTVTLLGKSLSLEGMVDTGNLLRDPVGGRAVICADGESLGGLLSPALANFLRGDTGSSASLSPDEGRRVRIIPAGTATGSGVLYGFLPDTVTVAGEGKPPREVDAVVAVAVLEDVQVLVPSELT
jgi:hypothetical protein